MIYIFALFFALTANALEVNYKNGYYSKVKIINDKRTHTGDYMTAETRSEITSATQTSTSVESANKNQPIIQNPVIVREKSYYSPYRNYGKQIKQEPAFGAIVKIGVGGQYLQSSNVEYTTVTGIKSNVIGASNTYAIVPVGLEFSYNFLPNHSFSLNGDYYINPLRNVAENNYQNTKVFEGMTNYMMYGKYAYKVNKYFGIYVLGGVSNFKIDVYNDLNGKLFIESDVYAPSFGVGSSFYLTQNSSIFLDAVYSYIGRVSERNFSDRRLNAISQRTYNGFEVRVGFAYNFGRAFATR